MYIYLIHIVSIGTVLRKLLFLYFFFYYKVSSCFTWLTDGCTSFCQMNYVIKMSALSTTVCSMPHIFLCRTGWIGDMRLSLGCSEQTVRLAWRQWRYSVGRPLFSEAFGAGPARTALSLPQSHPRPAAACALALRHLRLRIQSGAHATQGNVLLLVLTHQ